MGVLMFLMFLMFVAFGGGFDVMVTLVSLSMFVMMLFGCVTIILFEVNMMFAIFLLMVVTLVSSFVLMMMIFLMSITVMGTGTAVRERGFLNGHC